MPCALWLLRVLAQLERLTLHCDIVAHSCCSVVPPPGQFVDIYCLVSIGLGLAEHIGRFIAVRWRIYKRSRATVRAANG